MHLINIKCKTSFFTLCGDDSLLNWDVSNLCLPSFQLGQLKIKKKNSSYVVWFCDISIGCFSHFSALLGQPAHSFQRFLLKILRSF